MEPEGGQGGDPRGQNLSESESPSGVSWDAVEPCQIPKSLGIKRLRFLSLSFWEAGFFFWASKALHKPGN